MSNTTGSTEVAAIEALVQEIFEAYVRGIHWEHSILTLHDDSTVYNWVTASTICESITFKC